jgi:hypothetical protein
MIARPLLVGWTLSLMACGSLLPHPAPRGRSETGFLSAYGALQAAPGRPAVFVWRNRSEDLPSYDAVLVEQPSLRRRHDDALPSPEEREALCTQLRERIQEALKADHHVMASLDEIDRGDWTPLRIRVAVTTALLDRGDLPPQGEWQGWGDRPGTFSLECEVVDGLNARPVAKMVVFDRTSTIPAGEITPWARSAPLFVRWAADVAWLVQPAAPASEPAAAPEPPAEPAPDPAPEPDSTPEGADGVPPVST